MILAPKFNPRHRPARLPANHDRHASTPKSFRANALKFTMKASWSPGEASLIAVTFRDAEDGTELTILPEKLPADNDTIHLYEASRASTLNKLVALVEA